MADSGAGEIMVNSIDNDGAMQGYDLPLVAEVRAAVSVPVTALGGAGSLAHIKTLIEHFGLIGAAAGSLFVFKGVYRAVLINYPSRTEKDALMAGAVAVQGGRP
jgi:cyclase